MTSLLAWRRAAARGSLLLAVAVLAAGVGEGAAQPVRHATGQEVVPAYEGWERNDDGSFSLVFGTMNRNWEEALDIPIGPNNSVEPGGPDQGQPTHFLPRRNRFLFRIRVPADFGDQELVWTLTSPNGETKKAYASLHPDYFIDDIILQRNSGAPTADWLLTNEAPRLEVLGGTARTVAVGEPLTLTAVATDDGVPEWFQLPPRPTHVTTFGARGLRVAWFVYRGPGSEAAFEPEQFQVWEDRRVGANSPWGPGWGAPPLPPDDRWVVQATFDEPGTYVVRCLAHDGGLMVAEDITVVVSGDAQ
ncbi:MAG: hypothetical protein OXQ28_09240 [Acidobacteriota bacterium]|nr:hypothetical protein [Acidobacteriota bacterium]